MAKKVTIKNEDQWKKWLEKYHLTEEKVFLISYKKHTGKSFLTHNEQLRIALCYGWVDTTIKRIDDDKYQRIFVKRKPGATWSKNTLKYGAELLKAGLMSAFGKKVYLEGKKKKAIDHDIPDVLEIPKELESALSKSKKAMAYFESLSPSTRNSQLKWLFYAKRPETRANRIKKIADAAKKQQKLW